MRGLYIHIPFCATKCAYCDFYSLNYNKNIVMNFVEEMCKRIKKLNCEFDTVYFGGGTPSLIGSENVSKILNCVSYKNNSEITVECNPKAYEKTFFLNLKESGVNRISIGLQSANEDELNFLTRRHSLSDVTKTIKIARDNGFNNISLDVMIGLKNQTINSLKKTLDYCINENVEHISAYMLKIEENTPFSEIDLMNLPDDDETADLYLYMCNYLDNNGYKQYEISNFSKKNLESKHNLIYWNCEEYFGFGPAAHSMIKNRRYHFPRDIDYFLNGGEMVYDCIGADAKEYVMLKLRLCEGIKFNELKKRKIELSKSFYNKLKKYNNYIILEKDGFRLNKKGFLVQNSILVELLEEL